VGAYVHWTPRVEDPKPCEIPIVVEETMLKKALKFMIVKVENPLDLQKTTERKHGFFGRQGSHRITRTWTTMIPGA
jgi:hypothetical protein